MLLGLALHYLPHILISGNSDHLLLKRQLDYDNSQIELNTNLLSLKQKGTKSELLEAVALSIVGLSPQSISESILKVNDETNNVSRVNLIVGYLSQIGALGLNSLRDWYQTSSDKQVTLQPWSGSAVTNTHSLSFKI